MHSREQERVAHVAEHPTRVVVVTRKSGASRSITIKAATVEAIHLQIEAPVGTMLHIEGIDATVYIPHNDIAEVEITKDKPTGSRGG